MFITITVSLGETRYAYHAEKKTEIVVEGELPTLYSMCYGLGEVVGSGAAKLIDSEIAARAKAESASSEAEE
jgi:hypothetical protein